MDPSAPNSQPRPSVHRDMDDGFGSRPIHGERNRHKPAFPLFHLSRGYLIQSFMLSIGPYADQTEQPRPTGPALFVLAHFHHRRHTRHIARSTISHTP